MGCRPAARLARIVGRRLGVHDAGDALPSSGVSLGVDVRQRPDEAEDITQEVFVRTYRELGQYRSAGPLDAWLYRITRRAATQMRRMRRRLGIFGRPSNVFLVKVTYWFAR